MPWSMEGVFFENCSCDAVCPCTWSNLAHRATNDYCHAALAFRVDRGEIEGVDVSARTFVMVLSTPPFMAQGNWKVGLIVDDQATGEQVEAIGRVLQGQLGGPFEALAGLVGEFVGVEQMPIEITVEGNQCHVRAGSVVDFELAKVVTQDGNPIQLTNIVVHPAGPNLDIAPAARVDNAPFGFRWSGTDLSGFSNRFSWAA